MMHDAWISAEGDKRNCIGIKWKFVRTLFYDALLKRGGFVESFSLSPNQLDKQTEYYDIRYTFLEFNFLAR